MLPPQEVPKNGDLKAPFVRRDRWGEFGMAPQPVHVKIVLGLEAILFLPFRALGAFLVLILYWLICKASAALSPPQRAALTVTTGKFASRSVLFCLGFIQIKWVTLPGGDTGPRPGGIVSNHCSYTDILLHMADSFPAFVARKSTADLPFVGIIRCAYEQGRKSTSCARALEIVQTGCHQFRGHDSSSWSSPSS